MRFGPRPGPGGHRADAGWEWPTALIRTSDYLTHPVFNSFGSETAMMRYLKRLADRDFGLDRGMIPLGSCTMKLNAAIEMEPISWPAFADLHPYAPASDAEGSLAMIADLETWLAQLTGYDTVSLQPNAGSQGEYAGLLAIRGYHHSAARTAAGSAWCPPRPTAPTPPRPPWPGCVSSWSPPTRPGTSTSPIWPPRSRPTPTSWPPS
ncbi:hypothetical protein BWX38_00015 [Acidipropionibacterium acidipropionici]|nr:hypothetical protein BWX38_00015 [Acidipropionibacterium acidipropionici]